MTGFFGCGESLRLFGQHWFPPAGSKRLGSLARPTTCDAMNERSFRESILTREMSSRKGEGGFKAVHAEAPRVASHTPSMFNTMDDRTKTGKNEKMFHKSALEMWVKTRLSPSAHN
ncbi:hypothetical protein Pla52n_55060 [Stieleria varia]|uniref:Uncharacterized protein n=1 Tax=Stieleria varia TaxID=2528005 RepID=A0A5C6A6I5_9BACT|nr:hypothetical protein Pla52n_55060 [Stieleria varia]